MSHLDESEFGFLKLESKSSSSCQSQMRVGSGGQLKSEKDALEVVLAVLVELGRGDVETDLDLASVAGVLDGLGEEVERLLGALNIRGESTLVTDVGGVDAVLLLDDRLEGVVSFRAHLHGLVKVGGAGREDHELLEGERVAGVRSTVDDVHGRDREDVRGLDASEVGEVDVEGDALQSRRRQVSFGRENALLSPRHTHLLSSGSLGDSGGDTEDGVGAELALVGGAVEVDEELVDSLLVGDVEVGLNQLRAEDVVDIRDGLRDTCREPGRSVDWSHRDSRGEGFAPFPRYLDLSPSRSSTASWIPVEAPEGTAARKRPVHSTLVSFLGVACCRHAALQTRPCR